MASQQSGTYGLDPSLVRYQAISATFAALFGGIARFVRKIQLALLTQRKSRG